MFHLIKSKGCQRCGGDLFLEQDEYGTYVACIQCSAIHIEYSRDKRRASDSKHLMKVGRESEPL